jgi:MATE family multidrug resistance protein
MSLRATGSRCAERWRQRWQGPGGGREVLVFSYPLIVSQMTFTIQSFINRLLLTWYSPEAVAAATSSLFITQVAILPCVGVAEYTTTFIAHYAGAKRPERIGSAVWQGIWFAFLCALLLAALSYEAAAVFEFAGHPPMLRADESLYLRILLLGALPIVLMPALASFFAGRGETRVVLFVNLATAAANIALDYLWIFGRLGFPRGGVAGAALATVTSNLLGAGLFFALMLSRRFRTEFATLSGFAFDPRLFLRLLRVGVPVGFHIALGMLGLALFTLIIGRLGTMELAATGIAFSLNGLVFMPMAGLGTGVMALVGRYLGSGNPELAERVVRTAFGGSLAYLTVWIFGYLMLPHLLLRPYAAGADPLTFTPVAKTVVVLLRFIAAFSLFDMMNAIFGAGLRGAGDTTFPFVVELIGSWMVMLIPTYVACVYFNRGLLTAWSFASVDFMLIGLALFLRHRSGRWRESRVIDPAGAAEAT